jgi:hypothetical protein
VLDNTDNAVSQSSASTSRVKIENSNPTDSSIALGESGEGYLPNACQSQLMVAAYEPTQALRDQIALLNAGRPQGAGIPLCCQMRVLRDMGPFHSECT